MYVIIVGGEGIGEHLSKLLVKNGINVVIIEKNDKICDKLAKNVDALIINGDGDDLSILKDAGIEKADVLAAVTTDDSVNLMAAMLAKSQGVSNIIAVANEPKHLAVFESMGINTAISPHISTARYLASIIEKPNIATLYFVGEGRAEMFEVIIPAESRIAGKKLKEIKFPEESLIVAIYREGELIIPTADTIIELGDKVTVFASLKSQKAVKELLLGQG